MQVALASNPSQVFQITGAQVAQRLVSGEYKNYFYLFVNPSEIFPVNTTGEVAEATASGYDTNNIYWNVQTPPTSGNTLNYGTVGQDLDLGATSNTLSEWQWSDLNYVFSGSVPTISYNGSYDGGGPTACNVYSNNQERHSVYVLILNSTNDESYTITGGELIQQDINGVASTNFIALVNGTQGIVSITGDTIDCPEVANPVNTPSLRWYVRTPPVAGEIPGATITGNFGITGTVGGGLAPAATTNALELFQYVDSAMQTGYIPNEGSPTDISILQSTDPVSENTASWPG